MTIRTSLAAAALAALLLACGPGGEEPGTTGEAAPAAAPDTAAPGEPDRAAPRPGDPPAMDADPVEQGMPKEMMPDSGRVEGGGGPRGRAP